MNISSKTGLIASPRKRIIRPKQEFDPAILAPCAITRQVPLALRPFGGLYNPYSKGCSVLCNHPAAQDVKHVVRLAKDAWINEVRTVHSEKLIRKIDGPGRTLSKDSDLPEHVPEEFFRRYTDTDSRPLTPTPTVASGRTRASVGGSHMTRRCVTPEPQTQNLQERKQLILDLRRSHSQETLYWNASSELSPSQLQDPSWMQHHSQIPQTVDEERVLGDEAESDKEGAKPTPMTCINAMEDGEEDPPRRRGKRRKKSKQLTQTISFTPNQDPETQVATIDPDSPNYSARPSLIPTGRSLLSSAETPPRASVAEPVEYVECFLDDEALCLLRRGLNIDIVEAVFDRYKSRAMREAFRTATIDKLNFQSKAVRQLHDTMDIHDIDHDKWIDLPRKYSRSSARFELPMDTRTLSIMTPIEYLKHHVVLSDDRKKLYHRIFVRNLPTDDVKTAHESFDNESLPENEAPVQVESLRNLLADVTRIIPMANFDKAMHEALGFHGTPEKIFEIRDLLELNYEYYQEIPIDFRSWCGIVAFAERYIITQDRKTDPCNELEMVDFESLARRIRSAKPSENLVKVLHIIKNN
ncbi:uncharacterized protein LOC131692667 [Topomyia yanbarensis]|uniref:uncharacterized protein LOC131692667 n=1 Tax=Topomyia yanbarensis TaxID=2498891 RepID=UPI00273CB3BB|nr:uncharacterized protein LOC131692667 [Topomyia yanbarensis]